LGAESPKASWVLRSLRRKRAGREGWGYREGGKETREAESWSDWGHDGWGRNISDQDRSEVRSCAAGREGNERGLASLKGVIKKLGIGRSASCGF